MNKQELAWLDAHGAPYRISVTDAGGYRIQAGDDAINISDQAALQSLTDALVEFHVKPVPTTRQNLGTARAKNSQDQTLDPNFPKKVRNAILIMVGIGVSILAFDVITRFG